MTRHPQGSRGALRRLVRLLPAQFRDRYGDEVLEMLEDDRRRATARGRPSSFWLRDAAPLLLTAAREHLHDIGADLRLAARSLARQPTVTALAALSLAAAIAAGALSIGLLRATFLARMPGIDAESLINVKLSQPEREGFQLTSYPAYLELADAGGLEGLAGFSGVRLSWAQSPGGEPQPAFAQLVSSNYFEVLGTVPLRGRFFLPAEQESAAPHAVISAHLWRHTFGGTEDILGRRLQINRHTVQVVGVAAEGFRGHFLGFPCDIFLPLSLHREAGLPRQDEPQARWVELVGRLEPGVSPQAAGGRLQARADALARTWPESQRGLQVQAERWSGIEGDFRGGLAAFVTALLAISALVLLVACGNTANLTLARGLARGSELALRRALGAPRSRLLRLMGCETLLLALLAAALGVVSAPAIGRLAAAVDRQLPAGVSLDLGLDPLALAVAIAIAMLTTLAFGIAPALSACRGATSHQLHSDRRPGSDRSLRLAVGAQVAFSVIVLVLAGLFARALRHAAALEPGFDSRQVVAMELDPALTGLDRDAARDLLPELLATAAAAPGVRHAALTSRVPLSLPARIFSSTVELAPEDLPRFSGEAAPRIEHAVVSGGFFATLGISLHSGRFFAEGLEREPTAVINRELQERYFGNLSPLDAMLHVGGTPHRIIGVVDSMRFRRLEDSPQPFLFLPWSEHARASATLLAKTDAGADAGARLRQSIRQQAAGLPLMPVPLAQLQEASFLPQRLVLRFAAALGTVVLLLSAIGLYGVMALAVRRRQREIGVRMSLGAPRRSVRTLILRQGLRTCVGGVVVGLPLAAVAARLVSTFLVGISPLDPWTYAGIVLVIVAVVWISALVPARRAAAIDPLRVLRAE